MNWFLAGFLVTFSLIVGFVIFFFTKKKVNPTTPPTTITSKTPTTITVSKFDWRYVWYPIGIGIFLILFWTNLDFLKEFFSGSLTEVRKTIPTDKLKGLSVKGLQPYAPYLIALFAGWLCYFTSNKNKYKNLSLAIFTFLITVVAIFFWLNPSYLMTAENPLKGSSMIEILFQSGSSLLSAIVVATAVYMVYIGHTPFAGLLMLILMVFTICH